MRMSLRPLVFWASLAGAAALALGPLPHPMGLTAAVVLITLALWSTALVPPFLTALIFFAAILIPELAAPDLVFAGFGSAAVWLIISGFVIGAAITGSGLGERLAGWLAPMAGGSQMRLVAVMTLAAMLLGFVMPSSVGRAVVLIPVGMALAGQMGLAPGSNGRIGLAVALTLACNMPSFAILPSNIPNMILAGAAEGQHGVTFGYLSYLVLHYPVLGVVKSAPGASGRAACNFPPSSAPSPDVLTTAPSARAAATNSTMPKSTELLNCLGATTPMPGSISRTAVAMLIQAGPIP